MIAKGGGRKRKAKRKAAGLSDAAMLEIQKKFLEMSEAGQLRRSVTACFTMRLQPR